MCKIWDGVGLGVLLRRVVDGYEYLLFAEDISYFQASISTRKGMMVVATGKIVNIFHRNIMNGREKKKRLMPCHTVASSPCLLLRGDGCCILTFKRDDCSTIWDEIKPPHDFASYSPTLTSQGQGRQKYEKKDDKAIFCLDRGFGKTWCQTLGGDRPRGKRHCCPQAPASPLGMASIRDNKGPGARGIGTCIFAGIAAETEVPGTPA